MGNGRLSGKQVESQVSRQVRRLAWIQYVCTRINLFPAHLGLNHFNFQILKRVVSRQHTARLWGHK